MGKGVTSGSAYYDVVITHQPSAGVLIKLPYTKKGGKFSFDLHHRIAITEDFGLPAEVTSGVAAGDVLRFDNFDDLRALLTEAEATVLARLAAAVDGA